MMDSDCLALWGSFKHPQWKDPSTRLKSRYGIIEVLKAFGAFPLPYVLGL